MPNILINQDVTLQVVADDNADDLFISAIIYKGPGVLTTLNLTPAGQGLYSHVWRAATVGMYTIKYKATWDSAHLFDAPYDLDTETYIADTATTSVLTGNITPGPKPGPHSITGVITPRGT